MLLHRCSAFFVPATGLALVQAVMSQATTEANCPKDMLAIVRTFVPIFERFALFNVQGFLS